MASDSWFTFLFATTSKFDVFVQNDTRTEQVEKQLLVIYEGSKKEIPTPGIEPGQLSQL